MIFSMGDHIEQIKTGTKTQTRRKSNAYLVGKTYSIQPSRRARGIPAGRILIIEKVIEFNLLEPEPFFISKENAEREGGYTPEEFEELYEKMYPGWTVRFAYTFKFVPNAVYNTKQKNRQSAPTAKVIE